MRLCLLSLRYFPLSLQVTRSAGFRSTIGRPLFAQSQTPPQHQSTCIINKLRGRQTNLLADISIDSTFWTKFDKKNTKLSFFLTSTKLKLRDLFFILERSEVLCSYKKKQVRTHLHKRSRTYACHNSHAFTLYPLS